MKSIYKWEFCYHLAVLLFRCRPPPETDARDAWNELARTLGRCFTDTEHLSRFDHATTQGHDLPGYKDSQ